MAIYCTESEAKYLREKAAARGEAIDAHACADGILRTAADKAEHDRIWNLVTLAANSSGDKT